MARIARSRVFQASLLILALVPVGVLLHFPAESAFSIASQIKEGMTREQVRGILGSKHDVEVDDPPYEDVGWVRGGKLIMVYFDLDNHVETVSINDPPTLLDHIRNSLRKIASRVRIW